MSLYLCAVLVLVASLCNGQACQQTQSTCVFDHGTLLTVEQLGLCLNTLTLPQIDMQTYVQQSLAFYNRTLSEHYAFADINNDSQDSESNLSSAYDKLGWGEKYNVTSPWQHDLNSLLNANMSNVFDFQSELFQITQRNLDDHVFLSSASPFYLLLPYILGQRVNADGAQEFYVVLRNDFSYWLRDCGHEGAMSQGTEGKTIARVNGKPALEYFTDIAAERVTYKHAGVRLNNLIIVNMQVNAVGVPGFRQNPTDAVKQTIEFSDGTTSIVQPVVYVAEYTFGSESLVETMMEPTSYYESRLVDYYTPGDETAITNVTTRDDARRADTKVGYSSRRNLQMSNKLPAGIVWGDLYASFSEDRKPDSSEMATPVVEEINKDKKRRQPDSSYPMEGLYLQNSVGDILANDNAIIVKYPSFFSDGQPPRQAVLDSMELLRHAVELGERLQISRVVFDLTNNLGGHEYIAYAWATALTYTFTGKNDTRVCSALDLRMGPLVTAWANLTSEPPQNVTSVSDVELFAFAISVQQFTNFLEAIDIDFHDQLTVHMRDAMLSNNGFLSNGGEGLFSTEALSEATPEQRAHTINTFRILLYRAYVEVYRKQISAVEFYGFERDRAFDGYAHQWGNSSQWTGVLPIAIEPGTYRVDYENNRSTSLSDHTLVNLQDYFFASSQKDLLRGGVWGTYTERAMHQKCTAAVQNFAMVDDWPTFAFRDVRFLSNGICGSSCAMFVNAVTAIGKNAAPDVTPGLTVTSVTYGGIQGQPMTGTQFPGGNVEFSSSWYERLFNARALLDPLYLHVGPNKDENRKKYDVIKSLTPLPRSAGVYMSFTNHEVYEIYAGKDSLPTEFYDSPSDVNLNLTLPPIEYANDAYLYSEEYDAIHQAASADMV
ncbi:hypothetical protein SARC_08161 [Sphaeroforma arctica JP610]|uniref:Tail specific protease domain-containing protein n=1 Tax=Sphaeroforma arctica JP610 TaxID=667725 RepID=A0A0L0FRI9_9EUKA|nr:hypothetical protein SARC_08161 [Sphaeroforma arctica JP610]KNC79442.1 hypothetical protein SARC_08161 [Sphaeroforma arctica JP610]|eukprot:XP_014153344.1 hypothetical protein SARC_08161 [Sphaeroforma arctica JP610]